MLKCVLFTQIRIKYVKIHSKTSFRELNMLKYAFLLIHSEQAFLLDCVTEKEFTFTIKHTHTHTHNRFTALLEYVRDHPGEQVQER